MTVDELIAALTALSADGNGGALVSIDDGVGGLKWVEAAEPIDTRWSRTGEVRIW